MAKFVSPLVGYNNNVRHKGRVFHIQTEDSGVNHPHIITHLFMDGGRILKSVKTSYAEHVGTEKMNDTVRQMMKDQHKAMFVALRDGQFDPLLEPAAKGAAAAKDAKTGDVKERAEAEVAGATDKVDGPAPEPAPGDAAADTVDEGAAVTDVSTSEVAPHDDAPATGDAGDAGEAAPAAPTDGPFRPLPSAIPPPMRDRLGIDAPAPSSQRMPTPGLGIPMTRAPSTDRGAAMSVANPEAPANPIGSPETAPLKNPSVRDLTLDFDALEPPQDRAARGEDRPLGDGAVLRPHDLPPPPANLFAKKAQSGTYSEAEQAKRSDPREEPVSMPPRSQPRAPATSRTPPPSAAVTSSARSGKAPRASGEAPKAEQRYAPARPAAVFGASGARPPPASIFSDELISDKSLDEVILSYLAEDLEPPTRK